MISYIKGILAEIGTDQIVIEAAGVGYGINIPGSLTSELPPIGTEVKIHTYFSVKEDSQSLYGFITKEDREMFRQLISVNGVGPKGALAILTVLKPDDLRMAIMAGDSKSISRAQGIGAKTAERVILDLRDKVSAPGFVGNMAGLTGGMTAGSNASAAFSAGPVSEAIDALTMLGYSRADAGKAVSAVTLTDGMTTEDVLKLALKNIKL